MAVGSQSQGSCGGLRRRTHLKPRSSLWHLEILHDSRPAPRKTQQKYYYTSCLPVGRRCLSACHRTMSPLSLQNTSTRSYPRLGIQKSAHYLNNIIKPFHSPFRVQEIKKNKMEIQIIKVIYRQTKRNIWKQSIIYLKHLVNYRAHWGKTSQFFA